MRFLKKIFNPNTEKYWDSIYDKEIDKSKVRADETIMKIKDLLLDKEIIMDFGAGPGGNIKLLSSVLKNKKFYIIDHSKKALQFAKNEYLGNNDNNNNSFFYFERLESIPNIQFDAIISTQVLEHITDYKTIVDELWLILKRNGILIISVPVKGIRDRNREHVNKFTIKSMFSFLSGYSNWVHISPRSYSARSGILATAFFYIIKDK